MGIAVTDCKLKTSMINSIFFVRKFVIEEFCDRSSRGSRFELR